MCRRQHMYCYCMILLGAGILIGHWISSWFWAVGTGAALIGFGLFLFSKLRF